MEIQKKLEELRNIAAGTPDEFHKILEAKKEFKKELKSWSKNGLIEKYVELFIINEKMRLNLELLVNKFQEAIENNKHEQSEEENKNVTE